ncbi:MAG: hypothetical protein A2147_11000 [Chloroflexi bacterium RBG_16_57_8]|nr:MAG: hypothetical protein A2147_11000 [Chloroflexi bacterium RBG_16_57_8]
MQRNKRWLWIPVITLSLLALSVPVSCGTASAEEIQGLLAAAEGKEVAIRLESGEVIRLKVEKAELQSEAQDLVGERVEIEARGSDKSREAVEIRGPGEDEHFTGAIDAIGPGTWTIGGQTFKVDGLTVLDGGLREGVTARLHFVVQADGTRLATEIETDEEDEHLSGKLESKDDKVVVVAGRTFETNAVTKFDDSLGTDDKVRVEFVRKPDGTELAISVEKDEIDDEHFAGVIEAIDANTFKIGGRTFIVNNATALDSGLAMGVTARVEFITMSDGTMVAAEIETDAERQRLVNEIESIGDDTVVIGGKTFRINETTRREDDLQEGEKVEVRFIDLPDGTRVVASIRAARPGDDGPGDDRGQNSGSDGATPEDQKVTGVLEAIGLDTFTINGQVFRMDRFTMIDLGLAVGRTVTAEFFVLPDGTKLLKEIETGDGVEPGDDKGGGVEPEPGDDKGGGGEAERGDDKGGASGSSGSSGGTSGPG